MAITSNNIKEVLNRINEASKPSDPTFHVTRDLGQTAYTVNWASNKYVSLNSKECYYFLCGVLAVVDYK